MKKTRWTAAAALVLTGALIFGGCTKTPAETTAAETTQAETTEAVPTAKELIEAAEKSAKEAVSMSGRMEMDIAIAYAEEGMSGGIEVGMKMDIQSTKDPEACYMKGRMSMMGMDVDLESYTMKEDGKYVTYTKTFDTWTKEEAEESSAQNLMEFGSMEKLTGDLTLREQTERLEGKEVYVIETELTGEALAEMMEASAEMLGEAAAGDAMDYSKMSADLAIRVYKESGRLAQVSVDMKGFEDAAGLTGEDQANVSIDRFNVTMTYLSYDDVKEIVVPEEAQKEAAAGGSGLIDDPFGEATDPDLNSVTLVQDELGNYLLYGSFDDIMVPMGTPDGFILDDYTSTGTDLFFDLDEEDPDEDLYAYYSVYLLEEGFGEDVFSEDHKMSLDAMRADSSYTNVQLSEVQSVMVGDREVKYTRLSYTYAGSLSYVEYNTWTVWDDVKILSCDVLDCADGRPCGLVTDEAALMQALYSNVQFQ